MPLFRSVPYWPARVVARFPPSRKAGTLTFTDFVLNNATAQTSQALVVHVFDTTGATYLFTLSGTTDSGADLALVSPSLVPGTTYEGFIRLGSGPRGNFRLTAT
jgi:hypothetical protein